MIKEGWKCPQCGKIYAPWVPSCDDCVSYTESTSPNIGPYSPYTIPTSVPCTEKPVEFVPWFSVST